MKYLNQVWDFVFGVLLFAGVPPILFFGSGRILFWCGDKLGAGMWWGAVVIPVTIGTGIFALVRVVRYRRRRRLITHKLLPVELMTGILLGVAYMFVFFAVSMFSALE